MTTYTHCPCCGKELKQDVQRYPAKYNRPERQIVTCFDGIMPDGSPCPVDKFTLTPEQHATFAAEKLAERCQV